MKYKIKKWLLGSISGLILFSIITNVLWELIKSSTGSILVFFVNIATLGVSALQDNIYKEIARGLHENLSLQMYTILVTLLIGFIISTILSIFLLKKKLRKEDNTDENKRGLTLKFLKSKWSSFVFAGYLIFACTFFVFDAARSIYINKAIAYYLQLTVIIQPEISDDQYRIINSDFAQIQNSQDYLKIIHRLEELAKIKSYKIPPRPSIL